MWARRPGVGREADAGCPKLAPRRGLRARRDCPLLTEPSAGAAAYPGRRRGAPPHRARPAPPANPDTPQSGPCRRTPDRHAHLPDARAPRAGPPPHEPAARRPLDDRADLDRRRRVLAHRPAGQRLAVLRADLGGHLAGGHARAADDPGDRARHRRRHRHRDRRPDRRGARDQHAGADARRRARRWGRPCSSAAARSSSARRGSRRSSSRPPSSRTGSPRTASSTR